MLRNMYCQHLWFDHNCIDMYMYVCYLSRECIDLIYCAEVYKVIYWAYTQRPIN